MRDTWYGDKRDLAKWGTLTHVAEREAIDLIVQIPYLRSGRRSPLHTAAGPVEIESAVWDFFRTVSAVEALGKNLGRTIVVIQDAFNPRHRDAYRRLITNRLARLQQHKVVLLDPDTGLASTKAAAEHVTESDVRAIWQSLLNGDWLVLYQHASRSKTWSGDAKLRFSAACGARSVEVFTAPEIASDVAFFAAMKSNAYPEEFRARSRCVQ